MITGRVRRMVGTLARNHEVRLLGEEISELKKFLNRGFLERKLIRFS